MCGIVGYIGYRDAYPILIKGLQRLEYRGYDSAGVALFDGTNINLAKTKGKVEDLNKKAEADISLKGTLGIGHTRWATHGRPSEQRALVRNPGGGAGVPFRSAQYHWRRDAARNCAPP